MYRIRYDNDNPTDDVVCVGGSKQSNTVSWRYDHGDGNGEWWHAKLLGYGYVYGICGSL
jgi:hypothetical protein